MIRVPRPWPPGPCSKSYSVSQGSSWIQIVAVDGHSSGLAKSVRVSAGEHHRITVRHFRRLCHLLRQRQVRRRLVRGRRRRALPDLCLLFAAASSSGTSPSRWSTRPRASRSPRSPSARNRPGRRDWSMRHGGASWARRLGSAMALLALFGCASGSDSEAGLDKICARTGADAGVGGLRHLRRTAAAAAADGPSSAFGRHAKRRAAAPSCRTPPRDPPSGRGMSRWPGLR